MHRQGRIVDNSTTGHIERIAASFGRSHRLKVIEVKQ